MDLPNPTPTGRPPNNLLHLVGDSAKKPLKDLLIPGGKELGIRERGAGAEVRTVGPAEFDRLKNEMLDGAQKVPAPSNYTGDWYKRQDGTIIGSRSSPGSGPTLEVIQGGNSGIQNGYKVHTK